MDLMLEKACPHGVRVPPPPPPVSVRLGAVVTALPGGDRDAAERGARVEVGVWRLGYGGGWGKGGGGDVCLQSQDRDVCLEDHNLEAPVWHARGDRGGGIGACCVEMF